MKANLHTNEMGTQTDRYIYTHMRNILAEYLLLQDIEHPQWFSEFINLWIFMSVPRTLFCKNMYMKWW